MFLGGEEYETLMLDNSKSQEIDDELGTCDVIGYLNSSERIFPELYQTDEFDFDSRYGDELAYVVDQLEEKGSVKRIWEYSMPEHVTAAVENFWADCDLTNSEIPEKSIYLVEAEEESALIGYGNVIESVKNQFSEDADAVGVESSSEEDQSRLSDFAN